MAKKMYYSEQEAASKLGITAQELAGYVRDQKLRVYMDGAKKMFRVDDVDALAAASGGGEIPLAPAEAGRDAVSLSEADVTEKPGKEDTVITSEGISIFDDEDLEIEAADPMAKTQIAPSIEDQITLEGVGSGSGLLDLTRESDDTSLGAEVLDHIDMEGAVGSDLGGQVAAAPSYVPEPAAVEQPVFVEVADPSAGLFNGFIIGSAVMAMLLAAVVLAAAGQVVPGYLDAFRNNLPLFLVAGVIIVAVAAVISMLVAKSAAARQEAVRRMSA